MYTTDELEKLSPEEKRKQSHSLQMQMVILDSDQKKLLAEKGQIEVEIKKMKIDEERLKIKLEAKGRELESVSQKIAQGEEELKRMRKKMNVL